MTFRLSRLAAAALLTLPLAASAAQPVIEVYKSATCASNEDTAT
jgi:hypothetical protein